jgi:D-3-phosphoglycerate dehydrogenase
MTYRILVSDKLHQQGIDYFLSDVDFDVDVKTGLSQEALAEIISDYDGLVIRSDTRVTRQVLAKAAKLKVIGRAGTGLDNVDIPEATRRGIVVMNTPGGNSEAAAELTLALIMAVHRHIPQAVASMKMGRWEKKKFQGRELSGKMLGVIGLGKIGAIVTKRAVRGLKMAVLAYDPAMTDAATAQLGAKPTSLEEIYRKSDVITVHTPLNDSTRGLIGPDAFKLMKDGVVIVNCARGGIVDENALLDALNSGKVFGAALDDFTLKPPGNSELVVHPRVITTPHLGASTGEAQVTVALAIAEQMVAYLREGIVKNAANAPVVDPATRVKMMSYMDLARRLGQFVGGLLSSPVAEMEVEYLGEIASWSNAGPITNAALLGLLAHYEGTEVNYVNARLIAEDRGIKVLETTRHESSHSGATLAVTVRSGDAETLRVLGALIRRIGDEPRIIGIDEFVTEAVPAGPMLVVSNRDIPGVVAGVSGALAAHKINIGQMNLSRDRQGGMALSIINIDTPADENIMGAIEKIGGIVSVRQVILDP